MSNNSKATIGSCFIWKGWFSFDRTIKKVVVAYDIPDDMLLNINQVHLPFIQLNKYKMDKAN